MDLATVGSAALALAIGFSLTEVMFWRRRRGFRYAMAILVSSGWFGFTYHVVHPYVRSTQTVQFWAASTQLLAALERLEPATRFGITPGGAAAYRELRRRSMATVAKHAWKSSDAAIVELAETLVRNAHALQRQDATMCVSYLSPIPDAAAVDYTRYLDQIAMKADVMALTGALESAANSTTVAVAVTADREHGIRPLRNRLSDRYASADFERFAQGQSLGGPDGAVMCRMTIDLYREALTLPSTQRARVLRHLMFG